MNMDKLVWACIYTCTMATDVNENGMAFCIPTHPETIQFIRYTIVCSTARAASTAAPEAQSLSTKEEKRK